MADSRSVMQEFRFLEQKRQSGALTPAEQARHAELRDLVGFEEPAPARGGFDVTAAAAQLRESLLPAGLRSRPADAPPPPPAPAAWTAPAPAPPPSLSEPEPPLSTDPFFDPASLGQEVRPQAWNPDAPGYDPDAPYDEAAWIAAGYDPNATYDWSALGEAAPPAPDAVDGLALDPEPGYELVPAEPPPAFGEYDAPGEPISLGEPEPVEATPVAPAPEADGGWFDGSSAPPAVPPPASVPAFGEYDAAPAAAPALASFEEQYQGGAEGDSLPGGPPLELGEAPLGWQPDGILDAGFELASDGSFGGSGGPPVLTPWDEADPAAPGERWESAPALDLSAPFEAILIPAARPAPAPLDSLEPEEALEPVLETLPAEQEPLPEPRPAPVPVPEPEPAPEPEPVSLADLEQPDEIDIPPEISAAYDLRPPATSLDFDAAPPAAAAGAEPSIEPAPEGEPDRAGGAGVERGRSGGRRAARRDPHARRPGAARHADRRRPRRARAGARDRGARGGGAGLHRRGEGHLLHAGARREAAGAAGQAGPRHLPRWAAGGRLLTRLPR